MVWKERKKSIGAGRGWSYWQFAFRKPTEEPMLSPSPTPCLLENTISFSLKNPLLTVSKGGGTDELSRVGELF